MTAGRAADERQTGVHLVEQRSPLAGGRLLQIEPQQCRDHDEEGEAVQREAGRHADRGERQAGDDGAENARRG